MRRGSWLLSIACGACIGLLLLAAPAAGASDPRTEDPELLFKAGLEDMLAGRYKIGCELIRRSLELDPRPGTTFTLAECYARAGKFASALELYDQYLALYEEMPAEQRQEQEARARISRAERQKLLAKVPWLTVVLPDDAPPGTVVTMNDRPLSRNFFGVAMAVDPGTYIFTTRAPRGPLIGDQVVEMDPGSRKKVTLDVRRPSDRGDKPTGPSETDLSGDPFDPGVAEGDTMSTQRKWAWALTGLGIAGLAAGGVTGVILLDKRSTIQDECEPDPSPGANRSLCSAKGFSASRSAQNTYAPVTTAMLGAGGGLLATGIILLVTDSPEEHSTGVRASFAVGPRQATMQLRGRF